jgi:hypothetical protein
MLAKSNRFIHSILLFSILISMLVAGCANVGVNIIPPDGGGDGGGNGDSNFLNNQFLFLILIIMIFFVAIIAVMR